MGAPYGPTSYTLNGVLYGNATGPILVTAQGGANSVLTANAGPPSFSDAPTIGTSVTTPQIFGGSAVSSSLTLRGSSAAPSSGLTDNRIFLNPSVEGNVGIGTSSPAGRLHVVGPAGQANLFILQSSSANAHLLFRVGGIQSGELKASTSSFQINANNEGQDMQLQVQGQAVQGIVIKASNGGVGIGTTTPARKLHVVGTAAAAATFEGTVDIKQISASGGNLNVEGDVAVTGNVTKGGGSFKIDHPLDPLNKYLYHSFVESPDMKNIYDGVALLDARGEAWVTLPEWFEALNEDFRYQLTCVGGFAPVYIAEKVSGNRFKIAGGQPGMEISWQITGVRRDPYARTHPIQVEEEKPAGERGQYLHPEAYRQQEQQVVQPKGKQEAN